MFNPKVSIIIPVYNGSNFVAEAINSAFAQTYKNIEIIVVNDGSTDNGQTAKIARSYGKKIRYFEKTNGGVATALNLGITKMTGEYFSWLSHDDLYYPDKIEKQIRIISTLSENDRKNTILFSNYALIDEKSRITFETHFERTYSVSDLEYPLFPLLNGLLNGLTLLIPKRCFTEISYFDPALRATQDYALWFKIFPKCKMIFMPELLAKTRWHSSQVTHKPATFIENDSLWINMVENMTDKQKIRVGGSVFGFYQEVYKVVKGAKFVGAEKFVLDKINEYKHRDITKIKVSIIIPFFNRVDWTIEAVKSALTQTHKNLQIILINDGSTEDTEKLKKSIETDKRIFYFENNKNLGVAKSRNLGLERATGEFIAFLDSDDLFYSEKIKTQLSFMIKNGYLFSHTSYKTFETGRNQALIKIDSGKLDLEYPQTISDCSIDTSTVMINRDLFENPAYIFPEEMTVGEDVCLWILLSKQCPLKGLDMVLTKYRMHGSNAREDVSRQILGFRNIFDFVFRNGLDEKNVPELIKQNQQFLRYLRNVYVPKRNLFEKFASVINRCLPIRVRLFLQRIR